MSENRQIISPGGNRNPVEGKERDQQTARIDSDSVFFNRIVPVLLISMGIVMAVLIILAAGVLLGFVPFS